MSALELDPRFADELQSQASARGISLSPHQMRALGIHYSLLKIWGRRMNLTAIRAPAEVIRRHFLESLLAGDLLRRFGAAGQLLDLGSGNGFPAAPIRVIHPEADPIVLVEASRKKGAFLRALLHEEGWKDSRVEVRRAQSGKELCDLSCDIFTIRAVNPFPFVDEGLPFLNEGGSAVLFMSRERLDAGVSPLPDRLSVVAEETLQGRDAGLLLLRKG
jgi:16S rRNA (guanine527-N7)-methyltransferase